VTGVIHGICACGEVRDGRRRGGREEGRKGERERGEGIGEE